MQLVPTPIVPSLLRTGAVTVAGLVVMAACAAPLPASHGRPGVSPAARMTINAGTTFVFDPDTGHHEVRGIAQVSNLGNCRVYFDVNATPCSSGDGHFLCVAGTMTITTLGNDKLHTTVVGWVDFDPNDPKLPPTMGSLHYDVTVTGGPEGLRERVVTAGSMAQPCSLARMARTTRTRPTMASATVTWEWPPGGLTGSCFFPTRGSNGGWWEGRTRGRRSRSRRCGNHARLPPHDRPAGHQPAQVHCRC